MTLKRSFRWNVTAIMLSLTINTASGGVVAVVSSKSAITTLSDSEVVDLFLGRVSHYPDGVLATPIDQVEGSAARNEFYERVAGKSPAQIKSYWSKVIFTGRGRPPRTIADSVELLKFVAANPTAIGYLDEKWVDASVRVLH